MSSPWFSREYDALASITELTLDIGEVHVFATKKPVKTVSVILRSDSPSAAEAFHALENGHELLIEWKQGAHIEGHYYVEVHVPLHSLETIAFSSHGTVAVHPDVLRRSVDAKISIASTGSGTLLINDDEMKAGSIHIRQGGPGVLQVTCDAAVVAYEIDVKDVGSGTMAFEASSVSASYLKFVSSGSGRMHALIKSAVKITNSIDMHVRGSGVIALHAEELTAHHMSLTSSGYGCVEAVADTELFVEKLQSKLTGAGDIKCIGPGRCNDHEITISGAGNLHMNTISEECTVSITGKGCVFLPEEQPVVSDITGSGDIRVFEEVSTEKDYPMSKLPFPSLEEPEPID